MTLIDQRILIDAPPHLVWEYVSDPDKLARWHAGYSSVSVLTTQRTGTGTRRRCARTGGGKDIIEEITAWVDGLGYEYVLVEGGAYRSLQGRIRLQAGPDGTSVQWTMSYEPKGIFGALRDRFGGKGQEMAMMATSLRQLRRQIDELGQRMDESYRAKVSIQDRLNADERAQYQRRHPAPSEIEVSEVEAEAVPEPAGEAVSERPPAPPPEHIAPPAETSADAQDTESIDSAPAEPVTAPTEPALPVSGDEGPAIPEPSFVTDLTVEPGDDDYSHAADTQPKPPEGLREVPTAQPDESTGDGAPGDRIDAAERPVAETVTEPAEELRSPFARPVDDVPLPPPPEHIAPPAPAPVTPIEEEPDYRRPTPARGIPSVIPAMPQDAPPPVDVEHMTEEQRRAAGLPPQTPKTDTGEISIWDVFGVPRPSKQDEAALQDLIKSVYEKEAALEKGQQRQKRPAYVRRLPVVLGLRLRLALQAVRVRLHQSLFTEQRPD